MLKNVGGKMKANILWTDPNTGATNESGFSSVPGGYRDNFDGIFYTLGGLGAWWSASESGAEFAWSRAVIFSDSGIDRQGLGKRLGFSLRCVRD
jgi:uncharacterized protein (TIGR02145 family)